jgi:hypothetical protein
MSEEFDVELEQLINKHSMENTSNTPDFLLAEYLRACLNAFNNAVVSRAGWYGRMDNPGCSDWTDNV